MKKRTMLILSGTAALLAGIIFFSPDGKGERPPESPSVSAATVSDRIDYFASHGWEVEEICGKFVTIPTEFSPPLRGLCSHSGQTRPSSPGIRRPGRPALRL
ncbi:MAG TPA: hypothetical protein PLH83_11995 [Ruminococcus sp.]|nr:hypothetical protein [Ruminococcus sp.]